LGRLRRLLDDLAEANGLADGVRFFHEGASLRTAYLHVEGVDRAVSYYVTPSSDFALLTTFPIEEGTYAEELERARKVMELCAERYHHAPENL